MLNKYDRKRPELRYARSSDEQFILDPELAATGAPDYVVLLYHPHRKNLQVRQLNEQYPGMQMVKKAEENEEYRVPIKLPVSD